MIYRNMALVLALGLASAGVVDAASLPAGWVHEGNAGMGVPNGVVGAPPQQGPNYYFVSTAGGVDGVGSLDGVVGGGDDNPWNGSTATTPAFSAAAGEVLQFFFNYVTSDGKDFGDYGWARLLDSVGNQVALLFTARTTRGGSSVPGFEMPLPAATLTPAGVEIVPGTMWDALGDSSSQCFAFATGCGHTGWIQSDYTIATAGEYQLQFGVRNWKDKLFDSGMAIAGAKVGDVIITPPDPSPVPLPASALLLISGLGGIAALRRRPAA